MRLAVRRWASSAPVVSTPPDAAAMAAIEADLPGHLARLNAQDGTLRLPDGTEVERVPHAHLWLAAEGVFAGIVSIRYRLNDWLRRHGGNVGYEVYRPLRRRGFGARALGLALDHLRARGETRALLTCDAENLPSRRIIERHGGVLEAEEPHPMAPGRTQRRYWIAIGLAADQHSRER